MIYEQPNMSARHHDRNKNATLNSLRDFCVKYALFVSTAENLRHTTLQ